MMNAQQAREFRERWQAVAAVEAEEQRAAPIALRWQQLNALFRLASGLGLSLSEDDVEIEAVRRRWVALKEALT
mgnify:CR=1 FL=1|jgi:hypothetical protein